MPNIMNKLIGALIGCVLFFGPASPAFAGLREQGANLYRATNLWTPIDYSKDGRWVLWFDPYSVFKVSDSEWDVNLMFSNAQNQYDPEQTLTYRIDCRNLMFQMQGWRVNGVMTDYKGPLGLWVINPTRKAIAPGSLISTAKEFVCGISNAGSLYYGAYSLWRDGQIRGVIDRTWIKGNVVTISPDNSNLRRVSLMLSFSGAGQVNFTEFFAKCDTRELMEAANGVTIFDWARVPNGGELFLERMCSNRFSFMTYQTGSIAMPKPKPVAETVPAVESGAQDRSIMDDAKRKCIDLGFLAGTPKFGQCVLKLTR